jgi:hypothetical protein
MRILLLIAVIALGADAILYSGQHTQSAWRAVTNSIERLSNDTREQRTSELRP